MPRQDPSLFPRSGLRDRKKARLLAEIGAATLKLLGRGRGHAVTVEAVAAEALITRATFYRYFDSLEDVLRHHAKARLREWAANLEGHRQWKTKASGKLVLLFRELGRAMKRERAFWRAAVLGDCLAPLSRERDEENRVEQHIREIIEDGQKSREFARTLPAQQWAKFIMGTKVGACKDWAVDVPRRHSLSRVLRRNLTDFFLLMG